MAAQTPITWIKKDLHVHESHSCDAPGARAHACTYENRRNRRVALKDLRLG